MNEKKSFPGKFITLEGGEGAGKTTNLIFIENYLKNKNIEVIITREPGGKNLEGKDLEIAEKIREILLDKNHKNMSQDTELLLMFASRAQHLDQLIYPALKAGIWVVCSRFTDSTYAYQGGGRGMDLEKIKVLEDLVQKNNFQPDLTLYFDLDVSIGMKRAGVRGDLDRIELENLDFFERVRAAYLKRAEDYKNRFYLINAEQTPEQVTQCLEQALQEFFFSSRVTPAKAGVQD